MPSTNPTNTNRASCSTDSPWLRCPRRPCQISYHPKNFRRHLNACRYFSCPNQSCNYLGTQKQVKTHESGCPYGLWSEEIGTTDPLSESPSEVLDILTSPNAFHSYPTDPSSNFSPVPSPQKHPSTRQRRAPESDLVKHPAKVHPVISNATQDCAKSDQSSIACESTVTSLRSRRIKKRATLDPYDPSSKRIFSLPVGSINPILRPAPLPTSKCSSPAPPPPPTRRLSTYELQRYRPDPQSTQAGSSRDLGYIKNDGGVDDDDGDDDESRVKLNHKIAQLESMKKCYSALLNSFDDIAYSISQNTTEYDLQQEVSTVPFDEFRRVLVQVGLNQVPETTFLKLFNLADDDHEREDDPISNNLKPNSDARRSSVESGCVDEILTADQLSDQVRMKIAESEPRLMDPMDSPGNVFGRKRKIDDGTDEQDENGVGDTSLRSMVNLERPTRFVQKLADSTLELSDEISSNLPSRCNFKQIIKDAQVKIQTKVKKHHDRLH